MEKPSVPPLYVLAFGAAGLGLVAQLGTSLAMDMAKDRAKLYGFLLLSLVFSASTTVLLAQLTSLDDYVCATIGTLAGAIPPLWTLRAAVKLIGQKYNVDLGELTNPGGPTAPKKEGEST